MRPAAMRKLILEAMKAGAIGFSTSTSPAHNGEGGKPMPSRLADEAELRTLVGCLREAGHGVFMLTKGGHTRIDFLEELARDSTRPVVVAALLHNSTNPDSVFKDLDAIADAQANGHYVVGAVSCCPLSMDFTLQLAVRVRGLESWQPALALEGRGIPRQAQGRIVSATRCAQRSRGRRTSACSTANGTRSTSSSRSARSSSSNPSPNSRAIADPLDFMLDLALEEDLDTVFSALLLNSDEAAVGRMLRHPASLVSLSDAGAHLTFFNDAGFGLHLLGHWVRERGVLTLADAVWRLTGQPAKLFGIRERGALKPGYHADLLLFDPATVNRGPKRRVFDLPGGHPRLNTGAVGVHGVWVNGTRIVGRDGPLPLPKLPGRLLREFVN